MISANRPGLTDYSLLLLLSTIFGASFMLISVALNGMGVMTVVAARLGLAAIVFVVAMLLAGQSFSGFGKHWWAIIATAIMGNVLPFFLIAWGQKTVEAGLAGVLMALMPLMTVLLAHIFTQDEKINRYKIIGIVLGLAGLLMLLGFDFTNYNNNSAAGQLLILLAAASYAFNAIIMKQLTELPRYSMIAAVMLVATALILPFSLATGEMAKITFGWPSIFAILILGVISTAGGNFLRFIIIKRQGASFLSQINYLVPVLAIFWAWLILFEEIQNEALLALGLILVGIAVARLKSNPFKASMKEKQT